MAKSGVAKKGKVTGTAKKATGNLDQLVKLPSLMANTIANKGASTQVRNIGTPLKTAGTKATKTKSATPKKTEQQVLADQYKALAERLKANNTADINAYHAEQQRLANQQRATIGGQYDKQQNQNYINYMMNQRDLPGQLARLGITGGASESSQLRANTNYENIKNNTESERNSALNNITNTMNNNLAQYRLSAASDLRNKLYANEQQRLAAAQKLKEQQQARQDAKKQRRYERYRDTIRRFDTIGKVDKAIAKAKKTKQPSWKIQLLQAQKADLVKLAKEEAKTSGGSGGGRSGGGGGYRRSYRRYGGGGSSSETVKAPKEKDEKEKTEKKSKKKKKYSKYTAKGKGKNYFPMLGDYGSMSVKWVKK